jgi:hypothetical protein
MRNLSLAAAVVLFSISTASLRGKDGIEYKGKDGTRVVIQPIRKWTRNSAYKSYESRVEFYSPQHEMLCALDYSSEDSEHGFGIVKAAWTPDSNYFVFSLTSSGGHQAWHAPTLFYSVRDSEIHSLDSYVEAAGISKGDFTLKAPNTVFAEVWRGESIPIKFRLDSLIGNRKSHHPLRCEGGSVIRAEPYSLRPDA